MLTNAELAFKSLDKDGSGFISQDELRTLSAKLSKLELDALMNKVKLTMRIQNQMKRG